MLLLESEYIQLEYQLVLKIIKPLYKQLNQTNLVIPFSPPPVTVDFYRSLIGIKQKLLSKGLHVKFIKPTAKGMFVTISWNSRPVSSNKILQSAEQIDKEIIPQPSAEISCKTTTPLSSEEEEEQTKEKVQSEITIRDQTTEQTQTSKPTLKPDPSPHPQKSPQNEFAKEETTVTKIQEFRLDNDDDRCRLRLHYLQMRARELGCGD